ncbi:MAG: S9 family peptidase [Bacteroidetes bacterium]|nr:S9 family peptidase [Bacteroidota bacterium]
MKTILLLLLIMLISISNSQNIKPPVAKIIPKTTELHGQKLVDNYFWLREKQNPDVKSYLDEENVYTEQFSKNFQPLADKIYDEVLKRWKQTDLSVPYFYKGYWYYTKTEEGKQYPFYVRKKSNMDSAEELILNQNELAKTFKFLGLGTFSVSEDGGFLAYSLDTTGFRDYYLYIKNLKTGEILTDYVGRVSGVVWANDNKTIYYTTQDHAKRTFRLFRHILGSKNDELLFEEKDELYNVNVGKSSDDKFIFLTTASSNTTEVYFLNAKNSTSKLNLLYSKKEDHEYYVDHRDGLFYIITNDNAKNFKVVTVSANSFAKENWKDFIPARKGIKVEGLRLFKNYAAVTERVNGLNIIRIYNFNTNNFINIPVNEQVYSTNISVNRDFDATTLRYSYQSLVTPQSIFEYNFLNGEIKLLKQNEVLGGYDPSSYKSERIMVKARDGVEVPVSLVYKKGTKIDGTAPMLLYGYGSYGIPLTISFSLGRLSLLDRGVIYAQAHIRGGSDLGEEWHDDGKMMKKKNTFFDFIDCADYLVNNKYTTREKLSIEGGSAGGLLIGAVLNIRPDLCKAAHLAVPFVDVINTMLDENLPLTVGEFLEWGNPKKKNEYDYITTYCPYTNLQKTNYPDILITTSFNDSQVMYWEPAKYTAKLRTLLPNDNLLLLKTNMAGGHGGSSGRYDVIKEQAYAYAFLLNQIGVSK